MDGAEGEAESWALLAGVDGAEGGPYRALDSPLRLKVETPNRWGEE